MVLENIIEEASLPFSYMSDEQPNPNSIKSGPSASVSAGSNAATPLDRARVPSREYVHGDRVLARWKKRSRWFPGTVELVTWSKKG